MSDATITAAGMRVIRLLVGHPPRTVGELIEETGVTRTAITEQLHDLAAGGFVERSVERLLGRGRPRHRYSATKAALVLLFANNQQLVVPAIWQAIAEIGGERMTQKVIHGVSRILSEHYREQITESDPRRRIEQFRDLLEADGGLVELATKDGQITITKRTCAFISMVDDKRRVCAIDLEMFSAIAGCPVRLVACRHDGAPCCKIEVDTRSVNGSHVGAR